MRMVLLLSLTLLPLFAETQAPRYWGELFLLGEQVSHENPLLESKTGLLGGRLGMEAMGETGLGLGLEMVAADVLEGSEYPERGSLSDAEGRSLSAMTQGYLRMQDGAHYLTIGRQLIKTPLLNDDATDYLPDVYGAAAYEHRGDWIVRLGHVSQMRPAIEGYFETETPSGAMENGVDYLGWEAPPWYGISHKLYAYRAKGLFDALYAQADGSWQVGSGWYLLAGMQGIHTYENGGEGLNAFRMEGGDDIDYLAGRIGFWYEGAGLLAAYGTNRGADGLGRMYGGRAELFTQNLLHMAQTQMDSPKTLSLRLKLEGSKGLSLQINHNRVRYETVALSLGDYTSWYADIRYKKESTQLVLEGEQADFETSGADETLIRFRLIQGF